MTPKRLVPLGLTALAALSLWAPDASTAARSEPLSWSSAGTRLRGELLLPSGAGPHPAVVLLHGSGRARREDFRVEGSYYASHGVAALIYDKRGAGASGGNPDYYRYSELAADAAGGIRALRRRHDIRASKIAVWGLSEGAFIAPLVAARDREVAAIVAV